MLVHYYSACLDDNNRTETENAELIKSCQYRDEKFLNVYKILKEEVATIEEPTVMLGGNEYFLLDIFIDLPEEEDNLIVCNVYLLEGA